MDPLSVLTTVISTAKFIIDWIDARRSLQENTLSNIQSTIRNIHDSILCSLLEKSELQLLDSRISGPLETLYDVLRKTQDHLVNWEQSKSKPIPKIWNTINPWAILEKLKKDEKDLMISMQILGTTIIAIGYSPAQASAMRRSLPVDITTNSEVKAFWTSEFGIETSSCSVEDLVLALGRYFKVRLERQAKELLASRLDSLGTGHSTLAKFDYFVGRRSILEAVKELGATQDTERNKAPLISNAPTSSPILILVDDVPVSQYGTLAYAGKLGATSYVFKSTEAAKDWIEKNENILRRADETNRLRIVSDNTRWERDIDSCHLSSQPSMNIRAGETILRYLRGCHYRAPVLIFSAPDRMALTHYVGQYSNAGSTGWQEVVYTFLDGLVHPENADDIWWRDYDVVPKNWVQPLLIWVDDEIENHAANMEYAKRGNVRVLPFTSTDAARTWISSNEMLLRRMERANLLRFISDNTRLEGPFFEGGPQHLNRGAGKQFLEFVRLNGYLSPFLIATTRDGIAATRYVCDHQNAGSTCRLEVLRSYLSCLVGRQKDDDGWKGCGI